jgi:hypothetical protein
MPMKLVTYISIFLLYAFSSFAETNLNYPQIRTYKEIDIKDINEETLVLLDIDNTILRAKSHYGSIEYFLAIYQDTLLANNFTSAQAKLANFDRWMNSQKRIKTKLIDEKIGDFINDVKNKNAHIFAFTARLPEMKEITHKQLSNHNITFDMLVNFDFAKSYKKQIFPDAKWCNKNLCNNETKPEFYQADAIFDKGVIFSNDMNSKGEVLIDFLQKYIKLRQSQKLPPIKKIIFVDDKIYNLESIGLAADSANLQFVGYHIIDDFKYDHNIALSEEEMHGL